MSEEKMKLIDVRVRKDEKVHTWFIEAVYHEETDTKITQHTIIAPLPIDQTPIFSAYSPNHDGYVSFYADLGFGELEGADIKSTVIEVKTKEMTVEEIENALGHKVKIVGDITKGSRDEE